MRFVTLSQRTSENAELNPWNILPELWLSHTKEQGTHSLTTAIETSLCQAQLCQPWRCDCPGSGDAVAVLLRTNWNNFMLVIYGSIFLSAWLVVSACWEHSTCALTFRFVLFCHIVSLPPLLSKSNLGEANTEIAFSEKSPSVRDSRTRFTSVILFFG